MSAWKFHLEDQRWSGACRLFIGFKDGPTRGVVLPFKIQVVEAGVHYDIPTLTQTHEAVQDHAGHDVHSFLQAALDCAWELGLRPIGFADQTNELTATRYHLEDMRALALPKRQEI